MAKKVTSAPAAFDPEKALNVLREPSCKYRFVLSDDDARRAAVLRTLAEEGRAEVLLHAEPCGIRATGLKANNRILKTCTAEAVLYGYECFWWSLVAAANQSTNTDVLRANLKVGIVQPLAAVCETFGRPGLPHRVLMIDGVEETFGSLDHSFTAALLRVVSTIEYDPRFKSSLSLLVFLRESNTSRGYENFEQLSYGKTLHLDR
jgi:hypothetical protein